MPGSIGGTDVYVCDWQGNAWSQPRNLGKTVNTEGNEMFPFYHQSSALYFASDGHVGLGGLDVFMSRSYNDVFGAPINLSAELNGPHDDFGLILDAAEKTGYFSSNRSGGKGGDDIYSITILKPFLQPYFVRGRALEKGTSAPLADAQVVLLNAAGEVINTAKTQQDGKYEFEVKPDLDYALRGTLALYFDGNTAASTKNLGDKTVVNADVVLEKNPSISLYCLVSDRESMLPVENLHVELVDNFSDKLQLDIRTPATGDCRLPLPDKKINDQLSFQIKLEKEGYLGKEVVFNHTITKAGQIDVHLLIDLQLDKLVVGMDVGKALEIKPIYFDVSKWNIRPDAAAELDKIVAAMQEHPTMSIELGSHTDCRASAAFNLDLSDKRAKASAAYIVAKGIAANRITGKGYGETKLVNDCACEGTKKSTCTDEQHQENRRTEFIIVKL